MLRPLRTINKIEGMRILVTMIISAIPALGDVAMLVSFLFFIFGIVGVQLFNGQAHKNCGLLMNPRPECVGCDYAPGAAALGALVGDPAVWSDEAARLANGARAVAALIRAAACERGRGGKAQQCVAPCGGPGSRAPGNWTTCPADCALPDAPQFRLQQTFETDRCSMPRAYNYPQRVSKCATRRHAPRPVQPSG